MDGTWIVFSLLLGYASGALPIFQVVKFSNDVCTGTTRNGTCYTTQECSDLGGTTEGNCAEGFGVCCIFLADCEETISQNNTYLVKAAHTAGNGCNYNICPSSGNICRIRFDLNTFSLAMQNTLINNAAACSAGTTTTLNCAGAGTGAYTGRCSVDQFQIVGRKMQSPVICGTAAVGQHMILDVEDENDCLNTIVNVGTNDASTSRQWDIHVTEYLCSDHDVSGPPGCLQYFTGSSGVIRDFAMAAGRRTEFCRMLFVNYGLPLHTDLLVVVVTLKSFSPGLYSRIEWAKRQHHFDVSKTFFSYFTDTNYLSLVYNLMVINTYGFLWINCTLLLLLSLACKIPYEKRLPEIFTKLKSGN